MTVHGSGTENGGHMGVGPEFISRHRPLGAQPKLGDAERRGIRQAVVIGLVVLGSILVLGALRPGPVLVAGSPLDWVLFAQEE